MGKSKCRIDGSGRECTQCREYKEWAEYHKGRGPNGRSTSCKTCCCRKSLSYFYEKHEERLKYSRAYYVENRESRIAQARKWKQDHPEAHRRHSREDYHRNHDARSATHKNWGRNNPDKVREGYARKVMKNPEIYRRIRRAAVRRYRQKWPEKTAHFEQRRRAAKLLAQPKWASESDIQAVFALAKALRACGLRYHVDHVVPLKNEMVCGLHVADNLRVICAVDNLKKHNKFVVGEISLVDVPSIQLSDVLKSNFVDKVAELAHRAYSNQIETFDFAAHLERVRNICKVSSEQTKDSPVT